MHVCTIHLKARNVQKPSSVHINWSVSVSVSLWKSCQEGNFKAKSGAFVLKVLHMNTVKAVKEEKIKDVHLQMRASWGYLVLGRESVESWRLQIRCNVSILYLEHKDTHPWILYQSLMSKVWRFSLLQTTHYLCHSLRVSSLTLKMAVIQNSHTSNWLGSARTYWIHLLFSVLCSVAHRHLAKSSNCELRLLTTSA